MRLPAPSSNIVLLRATAVLRRPEARWHRQAGHQGVHHRGLLSPDRKPRPGHPHGQTAPDSGQTEARHRHSQEQAAARFQSIRAPLARRLHPLVSSALELYQPPSLSPTAGIMTRTSAPPDDTLSLIHISEPTRLRRISYAVFCLKKKKT